MNRRDPRDLALVLSPLAFHSGELPLSFPPVRFEPWPRLRCASVRTSTHRAGLNRRITGFRRRTRIALTIGAAISLAACVTSPPVYGDVPECERLIPASLKEPVPGVAIPDSEEAEPWMQAFVGQTGALDKANERAPAVDHIYATCLRLHRDALNKAKRGWLARLFG